MIQFPQNTFTIFKGDRKTLGMRAVVRDTLNPLDLSDMEEIVVRLPRSNGAFTELKLSEGEVVIGTPQTLGNFSALIEAAVSATLNVGVEQDFDVVFTDGAGEIFTVRYSQALSVLERD